MDRASAKNVTAFRHRFAILKADDLGRGGTLDNWWRTLDLADERGIPLSIGAVGRDMLLFEKSWGRIASQMNDMGHELWNHSYSHQDYSRMSYEQQLSDLQKGQAALESIFGFKPRVFGAPFNYMSSDTIAAVEACPEFKCFYFPKHETRLFSVPYENLAPPEYVSGHYRQPDFLEFLPRYERRKRANPMVLQFHPPAWSRHGIQQFEAILDLLIGDGWQFVTLEDYMAYRVEASRANDKPARAALAHLDEKATEFLLLKASKPEAPPKAFTDFYFNRFKIGTSSIHSLHKRHGREISAAPPQTSKMQGLDIGAGIGNWCFAYAMLSENHEAVGVDNHDYRVSTANELSAELQLSDRVKFLKASSDTLPFDNETFDHLWCNNALNYMDPESTLLEMWRVMKSSALAYLGVQEGDFSLRGSLDAILTSGDAAHRINSLACKSASYFGLYGGISYSTFWSEGELENLCSAVGLDPIQTDVPGIEKAQTFVGLPIFRGLMLCKVSQPPGVMPKIVVGDSVSADKVMALLSAGAKRLVLGALGATKVDLPTSPEFERAVASAVFWGRENGFEIAPKLASLAARNGGFIRALSLYLDRSFEISLNCFVELWERDPSDGLAVIIAVASVAAKSPKIGRRIFADRFKAKENWNEQVWWTHLALCSATDRDLLKNEFRAFLEFKRSIELRGAATQHDALIRLRSDLPFSRRSRTEAAFLSLDRALMELKAHE